MIITRSEAVTLGLKFYFTGKPCKRNHITTRQVSNNTCYECSLKLNLKLASTEEGKQKRRKYKQANPQKVKQWKQTDRKNNKEAITLRNQIWRTVNFEHYQAYHKKYRIAHKQEKLFLNALRKRHIKLRTPQWADLQAIKEFYKNCPKNYHVDHIIPLRGKCVSGFHTVENLQYLPKEENLRKSNTYTP